MENYENGLNMVQINTPEIIEEDQKNNFDSAPLIETNIPPDDNKKNLNIPLIEKNLNISEPKQNIKNENRYKNNNNKMKYIPNNSDEINYKQHAVLVNQYKRKKNKDCCFYCCTCISHNKALKYQKFFMEIIIIISILDIIIQLINYKGINTLLADDVLIPLLILYSLHMETNMCIGKCISCFNLFCLFIYFVNIIIFSTVFFKRYSKFFMIYFLCLIIIKTISIISTLLLFIYIDPIKDYDIKLF